MSALARPELKPDILKLLTAEKRPFHLSSLLLEGIKGSQLAHDLMPALLDILQSESAIQVERHYAMEAFVASRLTV